MRTANTITSSLKKFENVEANLVKLEKLWEQISKLIPDGIAFGGNAEYDNLCKSFEIILKELPKIDGWSPEIFFSPLNEIAQTRLDYFEISEPGGRFRYDQEVVEKPGSELMRYRFFLNKARRKLIRDYLTEGMRKVETDIENLISAIEREEDSRHDMPEWVSLREHVEEIDILLGSNPRPPRWTDLMRHLGFAEMNDADDIVKKDWPVIKEKLIAEMYGESDPIPKEVDDLSSLTQERPTGPIPKKLKWENLTAEGFERLLFSLIDTTKGYQNCRWLTKTNAPDRGRDLSVELVQFDPLNGPSTKRVIIQCKHYLATSVSISDVSNLSAQMKLWEPPTVNICVVATSGRFTTDAISYVEKCNTDGSALEIRMWPESHLESLLAQRPDLIGEYNLR